MLIAFGFAIIVLIPIISHHPDEFNRIQSSLNYNIFRKPLIGFSWDSKTDPNITKSWQDAKIIAEDNGPELPNFTMGFKEECQNTDIRLIAHSLGAAVVNSTLVNLDIRNDSKTSSNNSKIIKSVHLLGVAINNTLIAKNTTLGKKQQNM